MKRLLFSLSAAAALALTGLSAQAQPRDPHLFCAAHSNSPGQGELAETHLPPTLRGNGAMAWRCADGRVLVCALGATGGACEHTVPVDARRMRTFRQYCRQNPNEIVPNALLHGLASSWRCAGVRPVIEEAYPVDRAGYSRGAWRPLP